MTTITVSPDHLRTTARAVHTRASEIEAGLAALRTSVISLAAGWQGRGHAEFERLHAEWQTAAARLQEALVGIGALLDAAAVRYEEGEEAIARSFRP